MSNVIPFNATGLDDDDLYDIKFTRQYADSLRFTNDMVIDKLSEICRENVGILYDTERGSQLAAAIHTLEQISRQAGEVATLLDAAAR